MHQRTSIRRRTCANALALAFGAMVATAGLVACDRPGAARSSIAAASAEGDGATPQRIAASRPAEAHPEPTSRLPSPEALSDTVITGKIKTALLADPGMAGADVSVNTDRGVVMLAGVVKNPEQTAIASAHAQRQDGVMRVDNHLSVPRQ
jgi:hyperosmotically inducible protein